MAIRTKIIQISLATIILALAMNPLQIEDPKIPVQNVPYILKKIAWCESKGLQFNVDGSVYRGKQNPKDVGRFQVNEHYHLEESKRLGIDIYTLEGNTEYSLRLYKKNGTRDWNWSKWCWDEELSNSTWNSRLSKSGLLD